MKHETEQQHSGSRGKTRKPYRAPAITLELPLETRAGTPEGLLYFDPYADLYEPYDASQGSP